MAMVCRRSSSPVYTYKDPENGESPAQPSKEESQVVAYDSYPQTSEQDDKLYNNSSKQESVASPNSHFSELWKFLISDDYKIQFQTNFEAFYSETIDDVLFFGMKGLMIFCIFSTLCLLAAGCCNGSLQLVMIVHKSFLASGSALERKVLMFVTMPLLLAAWAFVSAYVVSYTIEIVQVVFLVPLHNRSFTQNLSNNNSNDNSDSNKEKDNPKKKKKYQPHDEMRLTDYLTAKWDIKEYAFDAVLLSRAKKLLFAFSGIVFVFALVAAFLQRFDYAGSLFALSLICAILRKWVLAKDTNFSRAAIFMSFGTILCSLVSGVVFLCNVDALSPDFTTPAITKLLLVFVGIVTAAALLLLLIQVYLLPAISQVDNTTAQLAIGAAQVTASVLLFIAFWMNWSDSEKTLHGAFSCTVVAEVLLCVSLGVTPLMFVFRREKIRQGGIQVWGFVLVILVFLCAALAGLLVNTLSPFSTISGLVVAGIVLFLMAVVQPSFLVGGKSIFAGALFFVAPITCLIALYAASSAGVMLLYVVLVMLHAVTLYFHHLATFKSSDEHKHDKLCEKWIHIADTGRTRHQRFHAIVFAVCVVLNATIYFFAVWSVVQSFNVSAAVNRPKTTIESGDINRPTGALSYPICSQSYYHMSIVDASFLAEMTYFINPTRVGVSCGMDGNTTALQSCVDEYFTPSYESSLGVTFNWTVLNITVPTSAYSTSNSAYYGIRSDSHKLVVIGVRGSTTGRDWLEDMTLYSEISMMQMFSFVVPLVYIWPTDLIAIGVKAMSFMSSLSFLQRNARVDSNSRTMAQSYYLEVEQYLHTLQKDPANAGYQFVMIGHSLGGAVAGIVGARNTIRSIGFDPPGLIYSYRKFDITGAASAIFQSSTTIVRNYDPVPLVDRHAGEIGYLDCPVNFYSAYCHNIHSITCQLASNCEFMDYPQFNTFGGGFAYCGAAGSNTR